MVAKNDEEKAMGHSEYDPVAKDRRPWNVGRMVGAKRAPKPKQVWAIRFWLDREGRLRDRAMFDLGAVADDVALALAREGGLRRRLRLDALHRVVRSAR